MRIDSSRLTPRKVSQAILSAPQTTQIIARPVDLYVKPDLSFKGSSDGARNAGLIKDLVGNTVRVAGYAYQDNAEQDYVKGMQDANARLEMDKEGGAGFLHSQTSYENGYRAVEDEAKAINMRSAYLEALEQNNYFLDDADPRARMDELYKDIYSSIVTDEYLYSNGRDGVMSEQGVYGFKNALIAGEEAFNKAYVEDRKLKLTNATKSVYKDNLSSLYNKGLISSQSLSATAADIVATNKLSEGGKFLTNQEHVNMMIDGVGDLVLEEVNKGDFKKADTIMEALKGARSENGEVWYDEITSTDAKSGKQTKVYRDKIDNLQVMLDRAKESYRKAQEEALKKYQEQNLINLQLAVAKLSNLDDPMALMNQTNTLANSIEGAVRSGALDATKGLRLFDDIQDLKTNEGFPEKTKGSDFQGALNATQDPNTTYESLMNAYGYKLSKSDRMTILNEWQQNQTKLKSAGLDTKSVTNRALQEGVENIEKIIGARTIDNKIKDMLDPATAKAVTRLNREKNDFIMGYANQGKVPNSKEVNAFLDEMENKYTKAKESDAKEPNVSAGASAPAAPTATSDKDITKGIFSKWKK